MRIKSTIASTGTAGGLRDPFAEDLELEPAGTAVDLPRFVGDLEAIVRRSMGFGSC